MPYLIAAILSNITYAFTDIFNGASAKRNGPLQVAFWVAVCGTLVFLLPLFIWFGADLHRLNALNFSEVIGLGVLLNAGYLCFIAGMQKNGITLTGVIGGSFPAMTTVVAVVFLGEHVGVWQALAIAVVLGGIVCSSMQGSARTFAASVKSLGFLFALGAFVLWGTYFALIKVVIAQIGWFLPQYLELATGIILFAAIGLASKKKRTFAIPTAPFFVLAAAVLQTMAGFFFNYAMSKGPASIIAPIAGSSPAVFTILAYFIFHEQLNKKQWVGICMTLLGVVALSILT